MIDAISFTDWIVWALIGFVGGYMCSRLLLEGRATLVVTLAAMVGACLGGFLLMWLWQPGFMDPEKTLYLSLLSSLIGCGLFAWLAVLIAQKVLPPDDDDD